MKTLNQKGLTTLSIVLIVAVIIIAGGLVWCMGGEKKNNNENTNLNINNENINYNSKPVSLLESVFNVEVNTQSWQEYTNYDSGISFKYPNDYGIQTEGEDYVGLRKSEHIDFEGGTPGINISWQQKTDENLNQFIQEKEIQHDVFPIPDRLVDGYWYGYTVGALLNKYAYISIDNLIVEVSLSAFSHLDMLNVFDGIVLSVRSIN